jgi:hypothetical protein
MNSVIKKLRIKEGMQIAVINPPDGYVKSLGKLPKSIVIETSPKGLYDLVHLFVRNKAELTQMAQKTARLLKHGSPFWISYPKKSSKIKTDLSRDEGWKIMSALNFEGVSLIAIDETWTAGRFKFIENGKSLQELPKQSDEDLKYIDLTNKVVSVPPDLKSEFKTSREAQIFFETLSYTNRKEYVRWIIEAKRPETRKERLIKIIGKLMKGKMNPSEK